VATDTSTTSTSSTVTPEVAPADEPLLATLDAGIGLFATNGRGNMTKTATVDEVRPGDVFDYAIYVDCTGSELDCPGFTFTDVIPSTLEIVQLPPSNSRRTVTGPAAGSMGGTLTVTYTEATNNPLGTGLRSGGNELFFIKVRLPADTPLEDGNPIDNTATVTMTDALDITDGDTVTVRIPADVTASASKSWPGAANVIAGSDASSTVTIGASNPSPTNANVDHLTVTDNTAATWNHFDLVAPITLNSLPAGAQAQLYVCTAPLPNPTTPGCTDSGWTASGSPLTAPGTMTLDQTAANVTGVRVEFTPATAGTTFARGASGNVTFGLQLRDDLRTGGTIAPAPSIAVNNCALATAQAGTAAAVDSSPACATKTIWSPSITATGTKTWFADANGNFETNGGEYAVAGAQSGVSSRIRVSNTTPFPVSQIVVTEPSGSTDFNVFDVDQVRVVLPPGANSARVQISYVGGTPAASDDTYSANATITLPAGQPSSIVVTYTGQDGDGNPTITAGNADVLLHGHLTGAVTTAGTLTNCAGFTVNGAAGTTSASDTACGTLPVEAPNPAGTGVKNVSQSTLPADQPITYTVRLTNAAPSNVALVDPIISDPIDPTASPNPFQYLQLVSAGSSASGNGPATANRAIWVRDAAGDWNPLSSVTLPATITGIELRVTGDLATTAWTELSVTVRRAPGATDAQIGTITNCAGARADNNAALFGADGVCATVTAGAPDGGAIISKAIDPDSLPAYTPGLSPQTTTVTLGIYNSGNLSADLLQITDQDAGFFNAVDFVDFGAVDFPNGANQVTVDAFDGTTWHPGTAGATPALPGDIVAGQVRGLSFTFTSTDTTTNGGYVMPPCNPADGCGGSVMFDVSPLPALRGSDPPAALPASVPNQATGGYRVNTSGGAIQPTDPATDTLNLVPGTPELDVQKTPDGAFMTPGGAAPQVLTATNSGDTWLAGVVVADEFPAGLTFDETYDAGDGLPYSVTVTFPADLPADHPSVPAPAPELEIVRDGDLRIDQVRWTFPADWQMPPNTVITIDFQVELEPGVVADQVIENTMGATGTSDNGDLACTGATAGDGQFGDGTYCTDTADTTVIAGAAFRARKWVAGNAELGWYHTGLGEFVATGDSRCPQIDGGGGRLYTATPCIALVDRGGQFDYILRVENAGTQPAVRMALVDNLPVPGDAGLHLGLPRGTEWTPTLAAEPTYSGPAGGSFGYSTAAGGWCLDDLDVDPAAGCAAGSWGAFAGASTTAFRFLGDFANAPLAPGAGIDIHFVMNVPSAISQTGDVTIAWNSFVHAERIQTPGGGSLALPRIEPIKVGVSPLLLPKVSVGDYVWVDTDRDGLQGTSPDEFPLEDVQLTLVRVDAGGVEHPVTDVFGDPVGPTQTDATGFYEFVDLPVLADGEMYRVKVDYANSPVLAPYIPTERQVGDDRSVDSDTDEADSVVPLLVDGAHDPTLDFGFMLPKVSVGDYVWVDTDRDGIQGTSPDEFPLEDVQLTLVRVDAGGVEYPVTDVFGVPVGPTQTDATGFYEFVDLPVLGEGEVYRVKVDYANSPVLAPYIPTERHAGDDPETDSDTDMADSVFSLLVDGAHDPSLDFGFMLPKVSVGDYVWVDTDRDGIQGTSPDEFPLEDVQLTLVRVDAGGVEHPVTDVFGDPVGPTWTDNTGYYEFVDLPVLADGEVYRVKVDYANSPVLAPYIPTVDRAGDDRAVDSDTDEADSVVPLLVDGAHDPTLDFGFMLPKVSVGDYVWVDTDRDGKQDAGEPGIPGVTLTITGPGGVPVTDVFGNPVGPVVTGPNGEYEFVDLPVLPAGQGYTVTIDMTSPPLAPYIPTIEEAGDDRAVDSSTNTSTSWMDLSTDGAHDPTLDFGFVLPKVSVGDYVWVDTNRDGKQDAGEPGIPGVTMKLVRVDEDGVEHPVTDVFGDPVTTTVTDPDGKYEFPNLPVLPAGEVYRVYIDTTSPALAPYIPTTARAGGDRSVDSDTGSADSWMDLSTDGAEDPTLDFGFVKPRVRVGDYVWVDKNRNGVQEPGEPGIKGVRLTITGPDGGPVTDIYGNVVGPSTTDENGYYVFENLPVLPAGQSYTVHIDMKSPALAKYLPTLQGAGADRSRDSATNSASSGDLTQDGDEDLTLDFGFVEQLEGVLPATL